MILGKTKERILQYLESKGIGKPQFYTDLGIKRGLLDSDKMNSTVTDVVIAKILVRYSDVSPLWLLTGEGPMLRTDGPSTNSVIPATDALAASGNPNVSILYNMYKDEKAEKEKIRLEKESEIKELNAKIFQMSEEIGRLKAQLSYQKSREEEYEHESEINEITEAFTSESSGDYGEDSIPTKLPSSSKRSSVGKV